MRSPMADTSRTCPHCESRLDRWRVPVEATWDEEFFFFFEPFEFEEE